MPLSTHELFEAHYTFDDPFVLLQKGFYPRIYDRDIPAIDWYKSYINTYIERDVRQIKNISDLSKFQLFLKLCVGRIGQLLNISSLASDCGIDHATARSWLSILEASFIIFLLRPHHKNFNKRLVKQPKLYFYDTGIASYLLGIHKAEDLVVHFMKGALFENFVVTELVKQSFNRGREHNLNFWRDSHGHEVDVIVNSGQRLIPIEVKVRRGTSFMQGTLHNNDQWLLSLVGKTFIRLLLSPQSPKTACAPNSSSIRSSWLYFAIRSEREREPVLICPQFKATERSAIKASSVSPERWDMTVV